MSRIILSPLHYLAIAALAVPMLGLGYIAGNGDVLAVYRLNLEMSLSGSGDDYDGKIPDATQPILPIIAEANDLFDIKGKGPRADLLYKQRVANNGNYEERRRLALQSIETKGIVQTDRASSTYDAKNVQKVNRAAKVNRHSVTGVAVADPIGRAVGPDPIGVRPTEKVTAGLPIISQKRVAGVFNLPRDSHFGTGQKDNARFNSKLETGERPKHTGLEVKHVASISAGARKFFGGLTEHEFRKREHRCLATAIYFEARSEPIKGQLAVAQVIMNRVRSSYYADTVCGVVYEGAHRRNSCQFSFACDGLADKAKDKKRWVIAAKLATRVTDGKVWLKDIGYASHYHATYVKPKWRHSMKFIKKIGAHIFYRAKYFARPTEVAAIQ